MLTQRRRELMFALLLTVSIVTMPSSAADRRWTSRGQPGASVTALVMSPSDASLLYLAAYGGGVFRSVDAGKTWQAINAGVVDREIVSLAIDPIVPATLYAGTDSGGIFSSLDGGESWTAMSSFTEKAIHLAIGSERGTIYGLADGSIYRSSDAGATWSERRNGVAGYVDALSTAPSNPSKLFAGTSTGLFTSSDRGDTWTRVPIPGVDHVGALAVSDDGRTIYATSGNFHTSTDGGATWTTVAVEGPQNPGGMTIDRSSSSSAWATTSDPAGRHSLYRTTDSGRTWRRLDAAEEIQALLPAGDAIYAATSSGLYESINAAEGWMPVQSGLNAGPVVDIALDAANPNMMVVAAPGGVYKTTTAGSEWFRSDDLKQARSVAIDPTDSAVVFASSYASARKTTDAGATWTEIRPNPGKLAGAVALAIDPANPSTVYAVLAEDGLSKSIDGGSTFSLINSGLQGSFYYGFDSTAVAIAPSHPSTLFTASAGSYVSVDAGGSWQPVSSTPVYSANALAVDPRNSAFVYAAGAWKPGLYRSQNGGYGWEQLKNGFTSESIVDVIVDPSESRNLYIATKDAGVYKSTDRGDTWTSLSEGLPKEVNALAIDSSGRFLAAATAAGVFTLGDVVAFPPALQPGRLESDPSRVPRLLQQLRALRRSSDPAIGGHNTPAAGVVFAVAGNAAGALGTYFRSDVTLLNGDASRQEVIAVWLAAGSDGTDALSLRLTLPSSPITVTDFIGKMGASGIGSLLVIGIDAEMNVDGDADLTGFSRIWTAGPGGRGTVSQSFPAVDIASLGGAVAASAIGLRMDADFRTNVGIVNLDATSHTFMVTFTGEQKSSTLSVHVEPFSMRQAPVPEGTYGALAAVFTVTGGDFPWTAYGASVDNLTGDGWASQAVPARPSTRPQPGGAGIAGTVYDQGGACLPGAVVEVLDGALAGRKWTQKECEFYWDYTGVLGYSISLPAGTTVRIRASMPGYRSEEKTFTSTTNWAAGESNFSLDRD